MSRHGFRWKATDQVVNITFLPIEWFNTISLYSRLPVDSFLSFSSRVSSGKEISNWTAIRKSRTHTAVSATVIIAKWSIAADSIMFYLCVHPLGRNWGRTLGPDLVAFLWLSCLVSFTVWLIVVAYRFIYYQTLSIILLINTNSNEATLIAVPFSIYNWVFCHFNVYFQLQARAEQMMWR